MDILLATNKCAEITTVLLDEVMLLEVDANQEENFHEDDNVNPVAGPSKEKSANTQEHMTYFTMKERTLLKKAFSSETEDGLLPPTGVDNEKVDQAIKKHPALRELYARVVLDKGTRSKANNSIGKSLGVYKKKPQTRKAIDPVKGKSSRNDR